MKLCPPEMGSQGLVESKPGIGLDKRFCAVVVIGQRPKTRYLIRGIAVSSFTVNNGFRFSRFDFWLKYLAYALERSLGRTL
jgi:hypothetical protein